MQKYDEAVAAALSCKNIDLAKFYAAKPEDGTARITVEFCFEGACDCVLRIITSEFPDELLRKALWLKIAIFVIEDHKTIKPAIEIMKESECLKIEDLLPHFPDFVVIDDFKDDICSALEECAPLTAPALQMPTLLLGTAGTLTGYAAAWTRLLSAQTASGRSEDANPHTPSLDPHTPSLDPHTPSLDPRTPSLDPRTPSLDLPARCRTSVTFASKPPPSVPVACALLVPLRIPVPARFSLKLPMRSCHELHC
jgi:hypothetical protein